MAEEGQAGPGGFFLDYDGQGNATSPEAQAAAAQRAGNQVAVEDTLNDTEMEALLAGDLTPAGAPPEGKAQETGDPEGSPEPTEEGLEAQVAQLTANMNQMGTALSVLMQQGQVRQAQGTPEPSGDEAIEATAKAALRKVNPDMDAAGIDWLYQNQKAVLDAAVAPMQARIEKYEGNETQRTTQAQVQKFDTDLNNLITKEGVADTEGNAELRGLIRENVIARFAANPQLRTDRLPAVVKDVKGAFTRLQHGETEAMRTTLRRSNDVNTNPPPVGRSGLAGAEDLHKKAVGSKRKEMDFGGAGSLAVVRGILNRASLNT